MGNYFGGLTPRMQSFRVERTASDMYRAGGNCDEGLSRESGPAFGAEACPDAEKCAGTNVDLH